MHENSSLEKNEVFPMTNKKQFSTKVTSHYSTNN